jgi:hypothetical protein
LVWPPVLVTIEVIRYLFNGGFPLAPLTPSSSNRFGLRVPMKSSFGVARLPPTRPVWVIPLAHKDIDEVSAVPGK